MLLPLIHIFTPLLLVFPVLTLFPKSKEPILDVPGLRPVTIRRVIPRRFLILTVLILLALTSFLDAVLLVVDLLTASSRDGQLVLAGNKLGVDAWVVYSVGGVIIWGLTAIIAEYRGRWGDKSIVVLATLAFVCEIPNLVYLAIAITHSGKWVLYLADISRILEVPTHPRRRTSLFASAALPHPLRRRLYTPSHLRSGRDLCIRYIRSDYDCESRSYSETPRDPKDTRSNT